MTAKVPMKIHLTGLSTAGFPVSTTATIAQGMTNAQVENAFLDTATCKLLSDIFRERGRIKRPFIRLSDIFRERCRIKHPINTSKPI